MHRGAGAGGPPGAVSSIAVAILRRYVHWSLLIAALPALVATYRLFGVVASRFSYPMDVEWMESGTLLHAYRLSHGLPIYEKPGTGFMPFPYPPLHAAVLAIFGSVFGLGYPVGRFVSIASTVVATLLLSREVLRQFSGSAVPVVWALLSVGAVAVGFPVTGGWYDVIRADSFATCLCVSAGVLVSAARPSGNRLIVAGVVMTAELFTRQTCAFAVVWMVAYACVRLGRRGLWLGVGVGAASAGVLAMLQWRTHGSYLYYTFHVLRAHPVSWDRVSTGLALLFDFAPYLAAIPIAVLFLALFGRLSARSTLWAGTLLATLPMALLPYAKNGGFENDFLPVVVLAGPTALCILSDLIGARSAAGGPNTRMLELVFAATCGLYLQSRLFDPAPHVITDERRAAARELNARVARLDGPALIPYSPFLAIQNGKGVVEEFHAMSWIDVELGHGVFDLRSYFAQSKAKYLLSTGDERSVVWKPFVSAGYVITDQLPEAAATQTFVGYPIVLRYLLERKSAAPGERCPFDFEGNDYAGWTAEGAAFRNGPTTVTPEGQGQIVGAHGQRLANSFVLPEGDGATGTLLSTEFRVDGARLALRIGGGSGDGTRVELVVDGNAVYKASGSAGDFMRYAEWDLAAFAGKTAQIRIVDADTAPSGHVLVDGVCWQG